MRTLFVLIGFALLMTGCGQQLYSDTKCVDGKYYIKYGIRGQYMLYPGECLDANSTAE